MRAVFRRTNAGRDACPIAEFGERVPLIIWSLTLGNTYEIVAIEAGDYRVVDDTGKPCLFDPNCFEVIDASEPAEWRSEVVDEVRYAGPPEWSEPGFFERWHDGDERAREIFRSTCARLYGRAP